MKPIRIHTNKGLKIALTLIFLLSSLSSFSQQNKISEYGRLRTSRVVCDGSGWMGVAERQKKLANNNITRKPTFSCFGYPQNPLVKQLTPSEIIRDLFKKELGFFCKYELALEKLTPISFRFRLGSLDYVNWMEQKPNAVKLQ